MAKKRNSRRRARGRLVPLLRVLSIFLTAVVIVAALTLFFTVQQISVSGNDRYSTEEIIDVCGVVQGDNLILLDKYAIAQRLYTELPYITDVRINRAFPDGLTVEVTETRATLAVEGDGVWWLVSETGKIVDKTDAEEAEYYVVLHGLTAQDGAIGAPLTLSEEGSMSTERLKELVTALGKRGMLDKTQSIDASDPQILVLKYARRFDVELYYTADFAYKLDCLDAVVKELEPNETGIIRMTMDDENEVRLIPYHRQEVPPA